CFQKSANLKGEFKEFVQELSKLIALPAFESPPVKLAPSIERGMTHKKRHEAMAIKSYLQNKNYRSFVDIGSGKGHLSMALLFDQEGRSLCVDMDEKLQAAGLKKIQRRCPELENSISYQNATFCSKLPLTPPKDSLLLALHCCGDLSVEAMKFHLQNKLDLFNFGCCYHKSQHYNLSKLSQEDPLGFSFHALNLATRSNRVLALEDFKRREKVKAYRYILHMILHDELNKDFETLGNAHYTDYDLPFEVYARKHAPKTAQLDLKTLCHKYKNSPSLKEYLLAEVIRAPLGRVVEMYLLLDRALWLQEQGKTVELKSFFEASVSPRNIGIYSV
ncbi:MAG: methyltransferase, partial [Bacteriovoracaceae bacterium]